MLLKWWKFRTLPHGVISQAYVGVTPTGVCEVDPIIPLESAINNMITERRIKEPGRYLFQYGSGGVKYEVTIEDVQSPELRIVRHLPPLS